MASPPSGNCCSSTPMLTRRTSLPPSRTSSIRSQRAPGRAGHPAHRGMLAQRPRHPCMPSTSSPKLPAEEHVAMGQARLQLRDRGPPAASGPPSMALETRSRRPANRKQTWTTLPSVVSPARFPMPSSWIQAVMPSSSSATGRSSSSHPKS
jgi:hypothetical protein